MHYDLIIITNKEYTSELLSRFNHLILNEDYYLIDPNHINNNFSFDYLIFSNPKTIENIGILIDNNLVITNYFFQTSFDHIFAIGKINGANISENEQFNRILDFLIN